MNLSVSRFRSNFSGMILVSVHKAGIGVELRARMISPRILVWMRSSLAGWVLLAEPYRMEP